jgi:hypothetical protein
MEPIYIPVVVALIGGPVMWFLSRFDKRNTEQHDRNMHVLDKLDIKVDQMNWKIDKIDGKVDRIDSRVTNIENAKAIPELKVTKPRSKRSV